MIRLLSLALGCSIFFSMIGHTVSATSSNLVISHIQTGGSGTGNAGQEFIALHNNANEDINITNWCVTYSDYTDATIIDLHCFEASENMDEVRVQAHGNIVIASPTHPIAQVNVTARYINSSTALSGTRGHVAIYDDASHVIDKVAWDNKASLPPKNPETIAAAVPAGGSMLLRNSIGAVFVDTDNNLTDFSVAISVLPLPHPLIDFKAPVEVVDACVNIPDVQETMPTGYDYDDHDNCQPMSADQCQNVSNVQMNIPQNMSGLNGKCYDSAQDACTNIDDFQLDVPDGFREIGNNTCKKVSAIADVILSEILANSTGTDTGNEFVELYNNDNVAVDLSDYMLAIGKNAEKIFALAAYTIAPGEYAVFSDADLGYTLLNTTTQVKLLFYNGETVDEVIPYQDPNDDISWSLIDDVWQFTDVITPGKANIAMSEVLGDTDQTNTDGLAPCPVGKYRNALTNRCRNIEDDASVLASCEVDEYRNPETNRCKKIALAISTLTPCAEGYERNEETNRCRKIQSEAQLASCAEGSERNPETNRCRKMLATTTQAVDKSTEDAVAGTQSSILGSPYALAAAVGTGAMGYGIYEWRTELGATLRRILGLMTKK